MNRNPIVTILWILFLFLIGITVLLLGGIISSAMSERELPLPTLFENSYTLKIVDEHEVQCISTSKDTVFLYLENSSKLSEETIIFIKKK